VHGVGAGLLGGSQDVVDVEVGRHPRAAQRHRRVGLGHVRGSGVVDREDRHRRQPQISGGAGDPDGDLAAVGDEQAGEHG
jgi:hypothetical protein